MVPYVLDVRRMEVQAGQRFAGPFVFTSGDLADQTQESVVGLGRFQLATNTCLLYTSRCV